MSTSNQKFINKLSIELIKPFIPDYKIKNELNVTEVFEPSLNTYEFTQIDSDTYQFITDSDQLYLVSISPESENRISVAFGVKDEHHEIIFPETNQQDIYKIISTLSLIIKDYLSKHPEVEIISWSSVAKTGSKKIGDTQRDKIYKLAIKRQSNLKDEDIVSKDGEYWVYLTGYNPVFEEETSSAVQNFFEPLPNQDIDIKTSSTSNRVDYYKDHIKNVVPSDFKVEKQKDKIIVSNISKNRLENNPEFKNLLGSLTLYMIDNGLSIEPLPNIEFIEDDKENASNILGRTAHYNPNNQCITLYTYGRHPKDILRSYSHEMIHHKQNLEGKLQNIDTQNINEDDYLKQLEIEAYRDGNIYLREWENSQHNN